jgi:hypothetical protein
MMTVEDAVRQRRSVRAFQPREVPQATLDEIFALAQLAPSNCNTQPWTVHVASGASVQRLRQRLPLAGMDPAQYRPDFPYDGRYPGVYKDRQHDAAAQLYAAMGIARDDKLARGQAALRNYGFFDAPHAAFVFLPEPFGVREAADCGIWAQTLMLLLTAHGLASCPQAALSFHPAIVREELGLPESLRLLFGISFGYEDTEAAANRCRVGRAALDQAVSFHR